MRHATVFCAALLLLSASVPGVRAQSGACESPVAEAYLDVNDVRARIPMNGALFYRGGPHVYEVPIGSGSNAIFASSLWIGGMVNDELRVAAARYGRFEFWAGPLDESTGLPPGDCSDFERIYDIKRSDIEAYERGGMPAADLADWPTGLGAPTLDASGEEIDVMSEPLASRAGRRIDLAAGERPHLTGDQMLWWVMNDAGNAHEGSGSTPIGLEVHVTAFAFDQSGPTRETTFYRYRMFYRGASPLEEAFIGFWQDSDLGSFQDDYVGSDTTLNLGFTYNADDFDEPTFDGYGDAPPAVGVDLVRGPIVPAPGDTALFGESRLPDTRNLGMTSFVAPEDGGGPMQEPQSTEGYYDMMQAIWIDGRHVTLGNRGRGDVGAPTTNFMFAGDPVTGAFWSAYDDDGNGTPVFPHDHRFVMSSGPFAMQPGDEQEVIYAVIWARGSDHLDSVTELRKASRSIQAFTDENFAIDHSMSAPTIRATAYAGGLSLTWSNPASSENFLDRFSKYSVLLDETYRFEGYNVYEYESAEDSAGRRIATYDLVNGVTEVIEGPPRGEKVRVAWGTDRGVQHFHNIVGLTSYKTYCFGVEAYAFQDADYPRVITSPVARVCAEPRLTERVDHRTLGSTRDTLVAQSIAGAAPQYVRAAVVDPGAITGLRYEVRITAGVCEPGSYDPCIDYAITRSDGLLVVPDEPGAPAVFGKTLFVLDGLEWSIEVPQPSMADFLVVANAAGVLDPPEYGAYNVGGLGFPHPTTDGIPTPGRQQATSSAVWAISQGGGRDATFETYLLRAFEARSQGYTRLGSHDYEIRFTPECAATIDGNTALDGSDCLGWRAFGGGELVEVPFEIWKIGIDTPNDSADDVRLVPAVLDHCGTPEVFDICDDSFLSDGSDDPFTDWVYFFQADNGALGEAGYECFMFGACGADEIIGRQILVNVNGGALPPYTQDLPEVGTVFRLVTRKGFLPGDVYELDTAPVAPRKRTSVEAQHALTSIGVVPNPYYAFSDYEVADGAEEVRFTNVPIGATIRVFTLSGSLVRTLEVDSDATPRWNLKNEGGRLLANGMYLVHVEVPDIGSSVVKFALVRAAR